MAQVSWNESLSWNKFQDNMEFNKPIFDLASSASLPSAGPNSQSQTKLTRANDQAIRRALETAVVEFIDAEGGGPGVSTGFIATAMDLAIARQGSCSFHGT